jgi:ABC-type transporter Mla subunit MlaD
MSVEVVLRVVLYVALLVLTGVAVWGIREIVGSARSVRRLSDELEATLPGLIERADATLAAVNTELVRVNGVVTQLEDVSDRVSSTTRAAQGIVEAPAAAVAGLAEGARRFLTVLFRS